MRKIYSLLLIISIFFFCLGIKELAAQTNNTPEVIITGKLSISRNNLNQNNLFLIQDNNEFYQIIDNENNRIYDTLIKLVKKERKQGKGVKATLAGKPIRLAEISQEKVTYTPTGEVKSTKVEIIVFTEFDTARIEKIYNLPLEETEEIVPLAFANIPNLILKMIQGRVIATHFGKIIPYIEVEKEGKNDTIVIVTSNAQVIKEGEGLLMNFSPKNTIKVGDKVEVWYQKEGNINSAKTMTILSD